MHVLDGSDHWNFESREEGTNSVWVTGQKVPNPRDDVTTPYGAKIQVGTFTENESYKGRWSRCHECVVFDPRQVRMRYIVMIAEQ